MKPADVQALHALRDRWRADAEASDDTLESRAFLACAKDLDALLHGAGRQDVVLCSCQAVTGGQIARSQSCPIHGAGQKLEQWEMPNHRQPLADE